MRDHFRQRYFAADGMPVTEAARYYLGDASDSEWAIFDLVNDDKCIARGIDTYDQAVALVRQHAARQTARGEGMPAVTGADE